MLNTVYITPSLNNFSSKSEFPSKALDQPVTEAP